MERRVLFGRHDGKDDRANPTHRSLQLRPTFFARHFLSVFLFNQTAVTINSVSLTIIFASSVIVADGGTVISIPQAINLMNAPIFSITPTIIDRTSPIIFSKRVLAIDGPYTIMSGPDSIIHTQEAVISAVETIISATEMDFLKADAINPVVDTTIPALHTIISAFPASFFAAGIIISAGGAEVELVGKSPSCQRGMQDTTQCEFQCQMVGCPMNDVKFTCQIT
ncbi:MAG: hypothetical protein DMG17_26935 [Acidobacteria bacterium]|nr:MAG: hypothetical protein DMG17_26935 [Acidobacteriota bacterium]